MKFDHLCSEFITKYQEKVIYENLNLQFEPNKTYAIIGPSGSGKSTILNSLARIIRPTQGQISIDNQNIWKIKEQKFFKRVSRLRFSKLCFN